jgi:hypothetical protein
VDEFAIAVMSISCRFLSLTMGITALRDMVSTRYNDFRAQLCRTSLIGLYSLAEPLDS